MLRLDAALHSFGIAILELQDATSAGCAKSFLSSSTSTFQTNGGRCRATALQDLRIDTVFHTLPANSFHLLNGVNHGLGL